MVCNENGLQVYEGWTTSGPVLLHASGNSIPANVTTNTTLLVHFHSDSSETGKGFQANFDVKVKTPPNCNQFYGGRTLNLSIVDLDLYFCLNSRRESTFLFFGLLEAVPGYGYVEVPTILIFERQGSVVV
jgi:hypothetical protein